MSHFYPHSLRGRNIRLLQLLPGAVSDPLQTKLVETSIDDGLAFEALSYVWGDPNVRAEIECEGKEFMITKNLDHALHHLRQPTSSRLIWIDAICINQDSTSERNQQVQLMKEIFTRATRVIVWLGLEDGEDVKTALSLMRSIYDACEHHAQTIGADLLTLALEYRGLVNVKIDHLDKFIDRYDPKQPHVWAAVRQFFARPWFTRIWCVQEIVLARDSIVLIGQSSVSWSTIGVAAAWLYEQEIASDFDLPSLVRDIPSYNAYCMFDTSDTGELTLIKTLLKYRDFNSTDPKDKVYGLLGLVQVTAPKPVVNVDYAKSVCDVYTDVMVEAIKSSNNLDVLSNVKHGQTYESEDFPSWLPRWDRSTDVMALYDESLPWVACGSHGLSEFVEPSSGILHLLGVQFDVVAYKSDLMDITLFRDSQTKFEPLLLDLWHMCSGEQTLYQSPQRAIVEMALTLTAGLTVEYETVGDLESDERQQFYSDYLAFVRQHLNLSGQASQTFDPADAEVFEGDWQRYKVTASRACDQRRFFRTESGFYGLGPACMQEGDIVVVLYGGKVPYALRPVGPHFAFLGEFYVDSIMRGEIFDGVEGKLPEEMIFGLL